MDAMLIYKLILCVIVFVVSLGMAAYMTWGERKLAAILQDRVGPDRAGPLRTVGGPRASRARRYRSRRACARRR